MVSCAANICAPRRESQCLPVAFAVGVVVKFVVGFVAVLAVRFAVGLR